MPSLIAQRPLCLSWTILWYPHLPKHNYCRNDILKINNRQLLLDCLLPNWHKDTFIPERLLEEYSNEAHQIAVDAASEFSKTFSISDSQFDHDGSDSEGSYAKVKNPKKATTVSKDFLNALLNCPIIYWPA
jgi:hypothetical protein